MNRREFLTATGLLTATGVLGEEAMKAAESLSASGPGKAYKWEDLTVDGFADAVKATDGVVLVPFGCLEKHGHHMPLGTDSFVACEVARRAAEKESAVVFPFSPFGMVGEVRHILGTMALSAETMRHVFEDMCSEFARNGLKKIIIVNDHGGNTAFLQEFLRSRLERRRDYQVYCWFKWFRPKQWEAFSAKFGGKPPAVGHACVVEASEMLRIAPGKMRMDRVDPKEGESLDRNRPFAELGSQHPIDWYANYPTQFAGDPRLATSELGEWLLNEFSDVLASLIRLVKRSPLVPDLLNEYYDSAEHPHV